VTREVNEYKGAHIGLLGPMGTFYVSRQVDRVSNRQAKIILLSEKNFFHQNGVARVVFQNKNFLKKLQFEKAPKLQLFFPCL
jgi:hypothetical protein